MIETNMRTHSSDSTICSTPPQHDFSTIIHSEESRYKRKGYGLISATMIAVSFFYFGPILCKASWPYVLEQIKVCQWQEWKFMLITTTVWHAMWVTVASLSMWAIYRVESSFFEKYKINSAPWPWNENREEWLILLRKSLLISSFNGLIILPLLILSSVYFDNWDVQYTFLNSDLPNTQTLML